MRSTTLLVAVAVLGFLVAATPTASAGHAGPTCTHEYVDHYKELDEVVPACAKATVGWLEELTGIQFQLPW